MTVPIDSLVDSHAHLGDPRLLADVDNVLRRAKEAGVVAIINVATDLSTLEAGLAMAAKYPWVVQTAAVHPHETASEGGETYFRAVQEQAVSGSLVAVGETGLDYHYENSDRATQQRYFVEHLRLAKKHSLPVIVHCREAFEDFFSLIDQEYPSGVGILHCFTGSLEELERLLSRGWFVSLSGIVTFPKSQQLRAAAARIPLSQLLVETDCPWLAPNSRRGQANEPAFIVETAEAVAAAKRIPFRDLAEATTANARRCFGLSHSCRELSEET